MLETPPPPNDPNDQIARRARVDKMTPGELAIREAVAAVEAMGADPRLTEAVILLAQAKERVADFFDRVDWSPTDNADLAAHMYNAYGDKAGWTTWDGKPMPLWADVGEVVQGRWIAAAQKSRTILRG